MKRSSQQCSDHIIGREIYFMKINTSSLRGLSRVYSLMKISGNVYYENVLLDFGNKTITWQNSNSVFRAPVEIEGTETIDPVFINGTKFFLLVSNTDVLEYDGEFFSSDGNRFKIEKSSDKVEFPLSDYDDWKTTTIVFSPELQKRLSLSVDYVEKESDNPFSALFFVNGKMVALNKQRFFVSDVSSSTQETFTLPFSFLRIMNSMSLDGEVELSVHKSNDSEIIQIKKDGVILRMAGSSEYKMPVDIDSDAFRAYYTYDDYVTVDSQKTMQALTFLCGYLSDIKRAYCFTEFHTMDGSVPSKDPYMSMEFALKDQSVQYKVPIISSYDPQSMDGKRFGMFLSVLKQAFSTLVANGASHVTLKYSPTSPVVYFSNADEDDGLFILFSTLSDEE